MPRVRVDRLSLPASHPALSSAARRACTVVAFSDRLAASNSSMAFCETPDAALRSASVILVTRRASAPSTRSEIEGVRPATPPQTRVLGSAVQGGAAGRVRTRRNDKAAGAEWFLPSVNDRPATCSVDARLHRTPVRRVTQGADQLHGKGFGLAGHGRKSGRPIAPMPSSATVSQYRDSLACNAQFNVALSCNGPRVPLSPLQFAL